MTRAGVTQDRKGLKRFLVLKIIATKQYTLKPIAGQYNTKHKRRDAKKDGQRRGAGVAKNLTQVQHWTHLGVYKLSLSGYKHRFYIVPLIGWWYAKYDISASKLH